MKGTAFVLSLIVLPILVALIQKELEGWLLLLPKKVLELACRRVPHNNREILRDEWSAELHEILHGLTERPLSRLFLGLRYSGSLLIAARKVSRELAGTRSDQQAMADETPDDRIAAAFLRRTAADLMTMQISAHVKSSGWRLNRRNLTDLDKVRRRLIRQLEHNRDFTDQELREIVYRFNVFGDENALLIMQAMSILPPHEP